MQIENFKLQRRMWLFNLQFAFSIFNLQCPGTERRRSQRETLPRRRAPSLGAAAAAGSSGVARLDRKPLPLRSNPSGVESLAADCAAAAVLPVAGAWLALAACVALGRFRNAVHDMIPLMSL